MNTSIIKSILSRSEMKDIMAGNSTDPEYEGGESSCYVTCTNCQNSTCQGSVPNCSVSSIWPICGSHDTTYECECLA
jgi:hypothetical protein